MSQRPMRRVVARILVTSPLLFAVAASAQPTLYYTVLPCRVFDSRSQTPTLSHGVPRDIAIGGVCGVPNEAVSVALNITAVSPSSAGDVEAYATGTSPTAGATRVTFRAGRTLANNSVAALGTGGKITALATMAGGAGNTVDLVVDVNGYFLDIPPVAVADSATVTEDDAATAVDVLANDTDADGGPISVTSVTQPANGAVVITGGGTGLTYAPNANYCNTPPGSTLDTFTYTLAPGGSSATVTMTVTCVDDAPVAVADAASVAEDSGASPVNVLANDTDVDSGPESIASVTQPANGTVVITGGGTGLTYAPNANYCNTPPGTTLDTFTYTLTPGSSSATVTMTVTCSDDAPVAVDDSATVAEDSGASAVDVLANDTDVDAGPKSVASVTQPANGTVVITGGGTGLTYQPNANYCNNPPGTTPDTFTYTLAPGSSTATVSVIVNCIDDAPVAVADAATVAEDSGATAIDVLANDTDLDGGPKLVNLVTQPTNGTVVITGGGTGLTYAPNANYCNTPPGPPGSPLDTFNYSLTPGGSSTSVTMTVTCVNDAPVLDLDADDSGATTGADYAVTYTEGDLPKLIEDPVDATVSDIDNTNLASIKVTITNIQDAGQETLVADITGTALTAVFAVGPPPTGVLTISGAGTLADYQTVLRRVKYSNTSSAPTEGTPRNVTFVANDGAADSNTAVSTVTLVAVDSAPVAVADGFTVVEDSGANVLNVLANDTDPDGGPKSIASVTQPTNGAVVITGGGTGLTYAPNANYCNTGPGDPFDTFTYTLTPGSSSTTVTMTVNCVDDPPVAVADAATVLEDSGATAVGVLANDTDVDGGPKSIASVIQPAHGAVVITGGGTGLTYAPSSNYCNTPPGTSLDTFTYTLTPGGSSTTVTMTVTCVDDPPVAVADSATVVEDSGANAVNVLANDTDVDAGPKSIASVTQPANGVVAITGGGTGLTYAPNANYCNSVSGPADTFTYTLTPGSSSTTVTMTVTCVDDPPVAVSDSATVTEDDPATAVPVLANDTDIDGGPKSIASVTQPANGAVVITGGGTGLTYKPNANFCNNPPGTFDAFTYTLTPGSSSATVSMSVICVNDAPILTTNPITYTTPGNTQLHVGATLPGVAAWTDAQTALTKSNPTDVDGPGPLEAVAASGSSVNGGSFSIAVDGKFTYVPPVGFTGTDSFTYQVTDNGAPPAAVTGTINITVGQRVWYIRDVVDANNPAGGDGRSTNAFDSIAAFNAATTNNGDIIFVFQGNTGTTPLAGGFTLKDGQKLWGEGIGLAVAPFGTLVPAGSKPVIINASGDAVSIPATAGNRQNVEVRGLSLQATGNAVKANSTGANLVGVTISDDDVTSAGLNAINLSEGGTGAFTATISNDNLAATGNAFDARTTAGAGTLTLSFTNNALVSNATAVLIDGSLGGTTWITGFANNGVSGNTVGTGISVTSAKFDGVPGGGFDQVSGGTTIIGASGVGNGVGAGGLILSNVSGDLAFTDLDAFADGGAAVRVVGTGVVNVGAGTGTRVTVGTGVAIFEAIGGPAVDVTSATIDLQPTSIKSTNSASTGVSLDTVAGTFTAGSGSTITNTTGTDFNVNAGNAAVTYNGTISDTTGRLVSVTSTTGGTKSFTGAISDTGSGTGTGISLTVNTGATISFTGTLTLSTGSSAAFTATGGGTVTTTDANSTLTTTTGTALNVANTTIGAGGLKFKSISAGTAASGPANGIVLNNTGASGGLTVSGTGSAGSGGTIQKTTGAGISLTSVSGSASLTDMNISNTAGDGISATSVKNFSCTLCNITNPGSSANKDGLRLLDLSGTASLTNVTVTGATTDGCFVQNSTATLTSLTVSGGSFGSTNNAFASADSGLIVIAKGTGVITAATVSGTTFANNFSSGLQSFAQDAATIGDIAVSGCTFTNNGAAAADFDAGTGSPSMKFHFLNNLNINGNVGPVVNVFSSATGTGGLIQGRIDGNHIGTVGTAGSGSTGGEGVRVFLQGVAGNVTVVNNVIRETACSRGISVQTLGPAPANGATRVSDVVITGNDVNNQSTLCTFPEDDVYLASDNQAGTATTLRAEVHNNKIKAAGASPANTDYPFDGNTWMYYNIATTPSTAQLVDFNGPHANANAAISATQTSGTAGALISGPSVALIAGPITIVP